MTDTNEIQTELDQARRLVLRLELQLEQAETSRTVDEVPWRVLKACRILIGAMSDDDAERALRAEWVDGDFTTAGYDTPYGLFEVYKDLLQVLGEE